MSTPFPVVLEASSEWLGNDGNWSSFNISVGTPPQQFYVLPSTTADDMWLPVPDGCASLISRGYDCGSSRGVGMINGTQPAGFVASDSSTWHVVGLYYPAAEQNLYGNETAATYGLDVLALEADSVLSLSNQTIGGIATWDVWLGTLGLGASPTHFDVLNTDPMSVVASMKASNKTASLSYGFFAGAWYKADPACLVFGGYDQSRLSGDSVVVPIGAGANNETELRVNVRSLQIVNSTQGTLAFPNETKNLSMTIDSTTAQIWLPSTMCDRIASAFGLIYENATELYLVNTTTHARLVGLDPQVTFTVSQDSTSNLTATVTLPYSAFDFQLGIPFYNSSSPVRYFPIRRAANESQLTLGRSFLQEAYLVVDYERGNFTIGPATHNEARSIVPILPPAVRAQGSGLSAGTLAGIVVGVVLAILLAGLGVLLVWRRQKRQREAKRLADIASDEKAAESLLADDKKESPILGTAELSGEHVTGEELGSTQIHEMPQDERKIELESSEVHEMPQDDRKPELGSDENEVHELPGSVVERELPNRKSVDSHR